MQIHENFHHTEQDLRRRLDRAAETQEILAKPVLLTEWQRLRPHALGWAGEKLDTDEWQPAYRTMAKRLAAAGYCRRPYARLLPTLRGLPVASALYALALVPIIRLTGDIAKMLGYPVGVWWRVRRGDRGDDGR